MPQKIAAGNEKLPANSGNQPLSRPAEFLSCVSPRPAEHFPREK